MAANSATAIPNAGMGAGTNNASAIVFRPIGWGDLDAVVDLFDRTWPQDVDKVGADMSRLISRYFVLHYLLPTTFANGAFAADAHSRASRSSASPARRRSSTKSKSARK